MKIPSVSFRKKARIEIIPLIDIMFFLLATFVMVSLSMVKNQAVPVKLPGAQTSEATDRAQVVDLSITEGGVLFWNREPMPLDQLENKLKDMAKKQPDAKVVIHGDEKAFLGKAVAVIDAVRRAGIHKILIQTKHE